MLKTLIKAIIFFMLLSYFTGNMRSDEEKIQHTNQMMEQVMENCEPYL